MLKILDRYIIKKYLSTFFFTCILFSIVAIVIDASEKIDDFLKEDFTTTELLVDYYLNFTIQINGMLWPLFAFISVIFFTSHMASNSEMISMLNSGMSLQRIARPYMIAAGIIVGLLYVGNHYLIPLGTEAKVKFEHKYIWKRDNQSKSNNIHLFLEPNKKMFLGYYNLKKFMGRDLWLEEIENGKLTYKLTASSAQWLDGERWLLKNCKVRTFDGLNQTIKLYQSDTMTIKNLTPGKLSRRNELKSTMTTPVLKKFIADERASGSGNYNIFEVERHRRTSEPFTIFILTLIGMGIAARKVRGGIGFHIATGLTLGGCYVLLSKFSTVLSTNASFSPLISVWIPNIIFMGVAWVILATGQK